MAQAGGDGTFTQKNSSFDNRSKSNLVVCCARNTVLVGFYPQQVQQAVSYVPKLTFATATMSSVRAVRV